MKRILAKTLAVLLATCGMFTVGTIGSFADSTAQIEVNGTYETLDHAALLAEINGMRKEACDQGVQTDYFTLKPSDYVPLKWSSDLEELSMEFAVGFILHKKGKDMPDGTSYVDIEVNGHRMTQGLKNVGKVSGILNFVSKQKERGAGSNHTDFRGLDDPAIKLYFYVINPRYKSVGAATFAIDANAFSTKAPENSVLAFSAEELSPTADVVMADRNVTENVNVAVDNADIVSSYDLSIRGVPTEPLKANKEAQLSAFTKMKFNNDPAYGDTEGDFQTVGAV